jgi:AcrR family transcriptional regulator
VVVRNQRERLVAAMAEACHEKGYVETSVTDLTHRAGLSTATFYKLFSDKGECVLEAHRELLGRLLAEVDGACATEEERSAKVRAGVRTVLALFAADPPTARLLTMEILVLGPEGVERHDAAVEAFVVRLRSVREPGAAPSGLHADWALVAGIAMLIGKRVLAGAAADLPALEDEVVARTLQAP